MSWRPDPEIDELFEDERERRLAHALRSVQAPEVSADPAFRSQLRRHLMEEAWRTAEPRMTWWQRLWAPQRVAWAMAGVGALLLAVVVYSLSAPGGDRTVVVRANVDNSVPVAAVQPVQLTFSQPMNKQTVEQALQIQPATAVSYQWTSDTQVTIMPASGAFAPNTQYTVSLAPNVAQTQQGRAVPASTPAVFTVKPTPPPTPAVTPSPSPAPSLRVSVLGAASDARPAWNYQGRIAVIGTGGELELFGIEGGAPEVLVPSGVTAFALSGQQVAYVRGGQVFAGGRQVAAATPAAPAIAVGFAGQSPVFASAGTAVDGQGRAVKLAGTAAGAWFSPDGQRLVYQGADKSLHEVDLATGKDSAWPAAATTFLDWSPDGSRVLYSTADGVYTADPTGQSAARLGSLPAAAAGDWTKAGQIVVEAGGQLRRVNADGTGDTLLGAASAAALAVSPSNGSIALVGGGHVAVGQSPIGGGAVTVDTAAPVVGAFEKARMTGDQAAATALTASSARTIAPAPSGIQRWFTVAALAGADGVHETVRVVLADKTGRDTSQLDESLVVAPGPDGKPVIASVADSAPRPYSTGPEVLAVTVTHTTISIEFDSDLTAASVPAAVRLTDASGKPVAAGPPTLDGRTVTLTPASTLPAGAYKLAVTTALLDANHRPAVAEFDLDIPAAP